MNNSLQGKARLFSCWMPERAGKLLDLGCAYSFMLNVLGKKAERKFGMDFDLDKLKQGSFWFPENNYTAGLGEALPYKDNSFDVITFFEVLEHVESEKKFISEVNRVLKPGGIIMLSVPNRGAAECLDMDNIVFTPLLWCFKKMGFFKNVSDYYLRYHRHYSLKEVKALLGERFTVEKSYYGGLFLNQIAFLIYKTVYCFLLLFNVKPENSFLLMLSRWMDRMTSLDFSFNFGKISDKLCVFARKRLP